MGYEVPQQLNVEQTVNVYTGAAASADAINESNIKEIPANSGGVILSSGEIVSVSIKALKRNSGDIYIGGVNNPPCSGYGFLLEPGEVWSVDVKNLNQVMLVSIVSGDVVSYGSLK